MFGLPWLILFVTLDWTCHNIGLYIILRGKCNYAVQLIKIYT